VTTGFADVGTDMAALQEQINRNEVGSWDVFGTRAFLKNNYLYRFAAAKLGLYGNSREEAIYPSYFTDADGKLLNASSKRYVLRFEKGQLPPAGAFWSFTMYDGKTQLLVANPLNRYLLNSTMLNSFKYGDDGSLTFYVQKDPPGADKESNWLPAPDGPFYCIMRIYMPKPEVIEGRWKNPPLVALAQQARQLPTSGIVESRLGKIELKNGYPTDETVKKLYDHIDFQRACQAYLWALPLMAMQEWQREHRETFGAANLDYVDYFTFVDKLGLLTANATTPYLMAFPNMKETGPLVMEVPPGATAGGMTDFWQRPLTDSGQTGPDKGHGGKFLVLGPDDSDIKPPGFYVVRSPTINVWMAHRTLDPDLEIAKATAGRFRIYPYSQRDNPPPIRHLAPGGREWTGQQPSGLAYWEGLAKVVDEEPALERDRLVLGMLHPLGIEKGKAFNPDARQQQILIEAAEVGEVMARTIGFAKRFDGVKVWSGKHWDISLNLKETSQEAPYYTQFDERTSWFYEAVGVSVGMMGRTVGAGQVYLEASKDEKDRWLDGGETYRLHVPPNPPVAQFWSVTVYDNESRCFVDTGVQPDRSSRDNIVKNDDGSVDLYFGPNTPAGKPATNWIQTIPDKGWFTYFRLYGPTQRYFDRTWVLPDLEKLG
jgi:hypothetical protein